MAELTAALVKELRERAEKLVKSGYGTYLIETLERSR